MKSENISWFVLFGAGVWQLPQLYAGGYLPLFYNAPVTTAVYLLSAALIYSAVIVAIFVLARSLRFTVWSLLRGAGLLAAAVMLNALWAWIFIDWEGQFYKSVWAWIGILTPLWGALAAGFIRLMFLRHRRASKVAD
ncbi:MAG: hypothetical protein QM645_09840 [Asticcacaulis sp.]